MNTHATFDKLAENAITTQQALATLYFTSLEGEFEPLCNVTDNFDAAYDDWVDASGYDFDGDLICWEIAADGSATDVTARMEYERDMLREQRGLV